MKMTVDLPDDLVREVKIRAVMNGRTVRDLVADLLRQGLGLALPAFPGERSASSMVTMGEGGMPVSRCAPDAPATRMSVAELVALDQRGQNEEDLRRAGLSLL
jgi:hypothetical protein